MTAFNDVAVNFSNVTSIFPKFDRGPTIRMFNKVNVSVKLEWETQMQSENGCLFTYQGKQLVQCHGQANGRTSSRVFFSAGRLAARQTGTITSWVPS